MNLQGEHVAPKDRAEAIATYLQDKHWTDETNVSLQQTDRIQDLGHLSRKLALASWSCSCFSKLSDGVDAPQKPQIID